MKWGEVSDNFLILFALSLAITLTIAKESEASNGLAIALLTFATTAYQHKRV